LNGVIQAPTSSFTVSGSTLTFASNLATGDVIDFIIVFGNSLSAGTPSDGTVTSAKLNLTSAVGIGESSPGTLLDIKGSPGANNRITINSSEAGSNAQVLGGIVIENQGDSVVQISGRRESATDDGYFAIETQATGGSLTERVRIHSGGVMSAANGIALGVGTANTASNVLDDYEEGTFTPALQFGGGTTGIAYSQQFGNYTKIGRLVHIKMRVLLSNKGSSSGAAEITGFPFNAADDFTSVSFEKGQEVDTWNNMASASNYRFVFTDTGQMNFKKIDTNGTTSFGTNATDTDFNSTSDLRITFTYTTT
jgi:hypothetical protein